MAAQEQIRTGGEGQNGEIDLPHTNQATRAETREHPKAFTSSAWTLAIQIGAGGRSSVPSSPYTSVREGNIPGERVRRHVDNSAKGATDLLAVQSDPPRPRGLGRCDATTPRGY